MARKRAAAQPAEESAADVVPGPPSNERRRQLAEIAKDFASGGWLPARESLTAVRAVPTIFPQVDRGTRVGGWPIDRIGLVHGPSNEGKTTFVNGLGLSFLQLDHFYGLVDAEYTTPITWLRKQMGIYADHPGFVALRPTSYEETVAAVRRFATRIGEAKAKGQVPEDTTGLVVVDSIRKLVPEGILSKILKEVKEGKLKDGVDGNRGMSGAIKAAMNAAWMDELVPLMGQTGCALVMIGRESQDRDASARDRSFGNDWKLTGGGALFFDSSIVVRVERASWVYEKEGKLADGEKPGRIFGERHIATIRKTKVEGKEDKVVKTYFHTSNGVHVPEGFDRARDVLELALGYGVAKQAGGGWILWGKRRWQGRHAAVKKLHEDAAMMGDFEATVRECFAPDEELPGEDD